MNPIGNKSFPDNPNRVEPNKENSPVQNVAQKAIKSEDTTPKGSSPRVQKLDHAFIPSQSLYKTYYPQIESLASRGKNFEIGMFLAGIAQKHNTELLDEAKTALKILAHSIDPDITKSYKKLIGMLDRYDEKALASYKSIGIDPKSTFYIRSALLIAAQEDNANIDSWMVYTKKGKPSSTNEVWNFLDEWRNWIPEAQGKIAKYIETAATRIRELSCEYGDNDIVLMKGGYGAGKTRMTEALFADQKDAVMAPDKAKHSVRRSMPEVTHAKAHIEGSQVAYKLFDACIQDVSGTVAYDSSLNDPADIKQYIQKVKNSKRYNKALEPLAAGQPSLKIYDVARKDEARFLAVLRRDVQGTDPRVPPHVIKQSAIKDKMTRLDCMKAVMDEKELNVEYNFISGDATGWNSDFVAKIQSCSRPIECKEVNLHRLALEGFVPESFVSNTPQSMLTKEKVAQHYEEVFLKPVYQIMQSLSPQENQENEHVFSHRVLIRTIEKPIRALHDIYPQLSPEVKAAISKEAFEKAFEGINATDFLKDINTTKRLTYLELPFITAASIHSQLKTDPF